MTSLHEQAMAQERCRQHQEQIERAFQKLLRNLDNLTGRLETLGENDMGLLQHALAGRFHSATAQLRALTETLKQDGIVARTVPNGAKVTVEVSGGVAEVTNCPPGIDVEIIDHDNEEHG
jgi:hypothetical protein